jgi:phosphoglycolate phosphatase-like HAD superfamily hydrolase
MAGSRELVEALRRRSHRVVLASSAQAEPTLAVLTGGFSAQELWDAGAAGVYESVEDLRLRLDETDLR